MPSRKSVRPGTAQHDRRWEPKPQERFTDVFEDCPPTQVPATALAKAINCWPQGQFIRPRNGTKLFGAQYPAIPGRTGYAAHKVGRRLISDSGNIFSQADVSNQWIWDNGLADEMISYVSPTEMLVRDNDYNTGTNCHVQGKLNLNEWHNGQEIWVIQLGNYFYTAPRDKSSYTMVHIFSRDLPHNTISEMVEDGDEALIQNSKFMYRLMLTRNPIQAYSVNTPIPTVPIESNDYLGDKRHQYRYIYSAMTLNGEGNFINRETPFRILTETGTNRAVNRRDWAVINSDSQIGTRSDTYGIIDGASLTGGGFDTAAAWTAASDWTFQININGLGIREIVFDGALLSSMDELATRIQRALRLQFPSATCEYIAGDAIGPRIRITSGIVAGGSVSFAYDGATGTNAAANLGLTAGAGATITTPYVGVPKIIRTLYLPQIYDSTIIERHWHHTHYSIYRTPDTGPIGMSDDTKKGTVFYSHLNERGKRVVNSPDEFYWNKDLRAAGAFIARRINGTIELRSDVLGGEFELADEGSIIEFEDGSRVEISYNGFINSKLVNYNVDAYYGEITPWMAACLGDGHAVRITKTGTIVTRVPGSDTASYAAFTAADERKPVWYPNGTMDLIKRVIDSDSFETYRDFDMDETAVTYDPTHRNYCDYVVDDILFQRASAWLCKNRFMQEVKPSNQIIRQPGFIICAARGGKELRYCVLEASYKYFVGYHVREYQTIETDDVIERLIGFSNRYSVFCKGTIWTGATNNTSEITLPETFQKIFVLAGIDKVSSVGLINYGSLDWVDDELVRFVTNTGEVRDFNGIQFATDESGPTDFSEDKFKGLGRFKFALKKALKIFASKYARGVGYIIWWREAAN